MNETSFNEKRVDTYLMFLLERIDREQLTKQPMVSMSTFRKPYGACETIRQAITAVAGQGNLETISHELDGNKLYPQPETLYGYFSDKTVMSVGGHEAIAFLALGAQKAAVFDPLFSTEKLIHDFGAQLQAERIFHPDSPKEISERFDIVLAEHLFDDGSGLVQTHFELMKSRQKLNDLIHSARRFYLGDNEEYIPLIHRFATA